MAKKRKVLNLVIGVFLGCLVSVLIRNQTMVCQPSSPQQPFTGSGGYSSEAMLRRDLQNTNESLLFVGVMTAAQYLDTRAQAVYNTWGKRVPGKIAFFSSAYSRSASLPLVALPDVDDSYPPQRKSFLMLKYMHDNFVDNFEWFMRADDDVYVRTDRLEELLRSVDSRKPWFIGQTGRGNSQEFGLLSLESDENFCMGGPGVILSRETLRRIAPHLDECLANLYTTHEDVELGRCVRRFAGVACTWSYEMQVILYHNQSGENAFSGNLKHKEVHRAITLHPIKHPENMYRLHKYVQGLTVQSAKHQSILLHRDIANSMRHLGVTAVGLAGAKLDTDVPLFVEPQGSENYLGNPGLLGKNVSLTRYKPKNLRDVLDWEFISKSIYSYKDFNPKRRLGSSVKEGLNDVIREVMDIINQYSKQRGRIIDFKEIFYGYFRVDPVHGVDLILDMLLVYRKYRGHKMTVHVRRHAYIQSTYTGMEIREIDVMKSEASSHTEQQALPFHQKLIHNVLSQLGNSIPVILPLPVLPPLETNVNNKVITFMLPLSGRYATFERFITMYEDHCISEKESTKLVIILYRDEQFLNDYTKTLSAIGRVRRKYPGSSIEVIEESGNFARGKALQKGISSAKDNDLLFFIDVDIVFSAASLVCIRQNTIRNSSVYFPIVYSLYKPTSTATTTSPADPNQPQYTSAYILNEISGFWRQFGFGIVSLYKSDFTALGGFNTTITGWGMEDVEFYDGAIRSTHLTIVRSADPGLVHVYHAVRCNSDLEIAQKTMCLGTQASTFGSSYYLQNVYLQYKHLFSAS